MNAGVKKYNTVTFLLDALFFVLGSFLYALSVNIFTAPNNIAPGGLTGFATMLNFLFGTPIGIMILALNVPLFVWGLIDNGFMFLAKTMIATVMMTTAIDVVGLFTPKYHGDSMLAAIFGGILSGAGMSLIFIRGGTTGGTDIIAKLINKRRPFLSMGKLILLVDILVIACSALVYRNFESPLYAVIAIFVSTRMIDTVIYGTDIGTGKVMFIITEKHEDICRGIMTEIKRGVTRIPSLGGYKGRQGEMIMCALRRNEVYRTYDTIKRIDPKAFIIVGEAGEIKGEGFKI